MTKVGPYVSGVMTFDQFQALLSALDDDIDSSKIPDDELGDDEYVKNDIKNMKQVKLSNEELAIARSQKEFDIVSGKIYAELLAKVYIYRMCVYIVYIVRKITRD